MGSEEVRWTFCLPKEIEGTQGSERLNRLPRPQCLTEMTWHIWSWHVREGTTCGVAKLLFLPDLDVSPSNRSCACR